MKMTIKYITFHTKYTKWTQWFRLSLLLVVVYWLSAYFEGMAAPKPSFNVIKTSANDLRAFQKVDKIFSNEALNVTGDGLLASQVLNSLLFSAVLLLCCAASCCSAAILSMLCLSRGVLREHDVNYLHEACTDLDR